MLGTFVDLRKLGPCSLSEEMIYTQGVVTSIAAGTCVITGAAFTAGKKVRSQEEISKFHVRCKIRDFP